MSKKLLHIIILGLLAVQGFSNNLKLSNISVSGNTLSFNCIWDNSWSDSVNHDAVWIFAKIQEDGIWKPLLLSNSNFGHLQTPDLDSSVSIEMEKDLTNSNILLFGIEMVYIPEDSFYVGDEKSQVSLDSERKYNEAGYYCMKYEINQQQYTDFLNTLPQSQHSNYVTSLTNELVLPPTTSPFMNSIRYENGSFKSGTNKYKACNFLSWIDLSAYLDWAGLRPMTEFEFEQICRGPNEAIAGEFAWGTDSIIDANTILYAETDSEQVSETIPANHGIGSHGYEGPQGPLRNGFAANDSTNRLTSGSSYYGVMEMSGNVWEQVITYEITDYSKENGDGDLTTNEWPLDYGAGHKGGAWNSGISDVFRDLAISDRFYIALVPLTRRNTTGGRGVLSLENNSIDTTSNNGKYKGGKGTGYDLAQLGNEMLSTPSNEIKSYSTYSKGNQLIIETEKPQLISIYTINGQKIYSNRIETRTVLTLDKGIYLIQSVQSHSVSKIIL